MKNLRLLFFAVFCTCFVPVLSAQVQVAPFLSPQWQFFDNSGKPLNGGCVNFFAAGTSTPQPTYTDSTGTVQATNPVILDSAGRAAIWLSALSYKIQVKTTGGSNCASGAQLWVQDNVTWATASTTLAGATITGNFLISQTVAATGGANQSGFTDCNTGNYWTGSASAVDKWCWQDVLGTGSNPTSTYTLTHSGSSGVPSVIIPTATTISGTLTANSAAINGMFVCPTTGANFSANLTAGLALVPAAGGYLDCRNLTGTQSMAADVTFTGPVSVLLAGNLVLSGTGRFIQPQAVENISLIGVQGMPSNGPGGGGTIFNYNGSDCGIKIGSASGITFARTVIADLLVNLTGGTGSGICMFRTLDVDLHRVIVNGANANPICVNSDGTGGFSSYTMIYFPIITGCNIGVQFTGPISGNNSNQIIGGTVQGPGKANVGSIAVSVVTGDSNNLVGVDLEAADIGLQFGANSIHNVASQVREEGSTINTHFKFIAGSSFNTVESILGSGTGIVVTNSGSITNFVNLTGGMGQDGSANNHKWFMNQSDNSMFLKVQAGLTADQLECIVLNDHSQTGHGNLCMTAADNTTLSGDNGTTTAVFLNTTTTAISAPTGQPVQFGALSGAGVQFWNSAHTFSGTMNPTLTAARTWTFPDATGSFLVSGNGDGTHAIANQTKRGVAGCTTGAAAGNSCASDITVTWTTAFADANYSVVCTGSTPTNVPSAPFVVSATKLAATVHINYFAITAAAASYATIDCIAVHD